jgi:hypothetical protein
LGAGLRGRALEAVDEAHFVALGLQAADEPGAAVGEAFVVEVDGVLRGQDDADAEGAGLLEEREQRELRGGIRGGREVAEDLVHIDEGAEAGGAGLGAHPTDDLIEEQGDEEHAFGVGEMGDGENGDAGLADLGV